MRTSNPTLGWFFKTTPRTTQIDVKCFVMWRNIAGWFLKTGEIGCTTWYNRCNQYYYMSGWVVLGGWDLGPGTGLGSGGRA